MSSYSRAIIKDVVIIGAGVSGLVTAKCLKESGFDVVVLERTNDVGGLWKFRENDYGVMRFTHINVSKYNYCFSDFPFPDDIADYPHNTDMAGYIEDYAKHFNLYDDIVFNRKALKIEQTDKEWVTTAQEVDADENKVKSLEPTDIYKSKYIAIATGHHAKPSWPTFPGMDSFTGKVIHSIDFKDALTNDLVGKRVLLVGMGNSAVDAAVNCATVGRCKDVYISTRSGAWVIPNYIFGYPTDLYACRLFLWLPWKFASFIFETVVKVIHGNPEKWNLNPRMKALQTQLTVSPTLIHHIQRKEVKVVPNIQRIENKKVYFMNGMSAEFDNIICCTGYRIDLPYLSEDLQSVILDKDSNSVKLYKNVFNPKLGSSMAFIGFVQPASGGVLSMSETQARWFAELCKHRIQLPSESDMLADITLEQKKSADRYYQSARHTIQRDPLMYNDEIASYIGAKPGFLMHPSLAWRMLFGSCGAAQYRLQGPHTWKGASETVKTVPVTEMMHYTGILLLMLLGWLLYLLCRVFFGGCCLS